jgi:hypothetical protein
MTLLFEANGRPNLLYIVTTQKEARRYLPYTANCGEGI